jgi:acyl dehydratase
LAITTQPIEITEELRATLVRVGNYTHPLFSDLTVAKASGMSALPLPGQALLLLAGGAAENSGAIDDAIALLELSQTQFLKPAFAGDLITLELTELDRTLTSKGDKAIANFAWKITNQLGEILATTTAKMLMRV